MKQYNQVYVNIVKISCEDVITTSPGGGGWGGGFGGEEDGFDTSSASTDGNCFSENA